MILIVDDSAENIFSLKRLLEANAFEVDTALSGEEALKKVLKGSYSLIILDVQMPGMDGFEVAEAISGHSKSKDTPIIFLSAVNTDKKFITKGYSTGGIDYVTKPFDPDILLLKVKTFVKLYEQTKELNDIQHELRHEIDVRKAAQKEQSKKTQELQSILESIPQIAFTASPDGKIEFVNEHWYAYVADKNEFPPTHKDDAELADIWQQTVENKTPLSIEVRIKQLDKQTYDYYLLRALPVMQERKIIKWVGTFTDIHEQKQITELLEQRVAERTRELQDMNSMLESSNNDLQQFASVASHDLKEPLRKIQVFSSIVKEQFDGVPESIAILLDRIISSSNRMTNLINDLLNYSRLSVKSLFQNTDLNRMISDILSDLEIIISERSAVINLDHFPDLEVIPGQMRQVLQNIISNALKFTEKGVMPVINIKAVLVAERAIDSPVAADGAFCRISISDNGIGFNEQYLDKIFTIFQRLNSREDYEGTGIGLAIAKKIIDKHNGIITARSVEGEGATFIMVIPVSQSEQ